MPSATQVHTPVITVPPQVPAPEGKPNFPRVKSNITRKEAKKVLDELTVIPYDLFELQPHTSRCWNCNEIGLDPNGRWSKVVCTWKYNISEKVCMCKDGEHAPFGVTVLFFTRANGQWFIIPNMTQKVSPEFLDESKVWRSNKAKLQKIKECCFLLLPEIAVTRAVTVRNFCYYCCYCVKLLLLLLLLREIAVTV